MAPLIRNAAPPSEVVTGELRELTDCCPLWKPYLLFRSIREVYLKCCSSNFLTCLCKSDAAVCCKLFPKYLTTHLCVCAYRAKDSSSVFVLILCICPPPCRLSNMASVPSLFKSVVYALVTAVFTSYKEPLGVEEWGRRYETLVSQSPIDPVPLYLPTHPAAKGVYAHNAILQNLTKLGEGLLLQPEDLVVDPTATFLYVTNQDGWIKKFYLENGAVENWSYVGGRPLGLALDNAGDVIVCEPTQGMLIKVSKQCESSVCAF